VAASSDTRGQAARATLVATLGTLAGYVASLLQWAVYARVLGVSSSTDALAAALAWIVGLTGLVGITFASVTVPMYLRAAPTNPAAARGLFRTAQTAALVFGLAIALLTFGAADPLSSVLLPGSLESSRRELVEILRVSAPLGFLWVLVYTLTSLANAHERYGSAAVATVIPSIPVIAVLLLLPRPSVVQVAAAFVVGMTLEGIALGVAVGPWRSHLVPGLTGATLARLGRTAAPVALAFLLLNVSTVVLRALASFGGAGDVSVVDYSIRIVTAAETVLLSGALAVVLTVWSTDAARSRPERLPVVSAVRVALGFVGPAAFGVAALAPAIVGTLFGGGRFGVSDVDQVSRFLVWISPGFAAHAMYLVVVRAMLARRSSGAFLASAAIELLVFTVAGWTLSSGFGLVGLGAAYSLSWVVTLLAAGASLRGLRDGASALAAEAGRAVAAGIVPAAIALIALQVVPKEPLTQLVFGGAAFSTSWLVVGRIAGLAATQAVLVGLPRRARQPLGNTEASGR
jgi:peptidoglycan biosynthesis protein MviN/MurJ (putative lipid II flippase)